VAAVSARCDPFTSWRALLVQRALSAARLKRAFFDAAFDLLPVAGLRPSGGALANRESAEADEADFSPS